MPWGYNSNTGAVNDSPSLFGLDNLNYMLGLGWHGPFPTKQAALNYYTHNAAANPGWKAPAGLGANLTNAVTNNPASKAVSAPFTSVTQFLHILTDKNVWIRVAEFTLGTLLIMVGLAHLTGADSVAAKVATKLPLGAIIP